MSIPVREYDVDGRITHLDSAGLKTYNHDDAFRITGITDTTDPALSRAYGYDLLDRLTSAVGTTSNQSWTYDANGNRLGEGGSTPSTYTISGSSNRMTAVTGALNRTYTHDAAGNITSDGTVSFSYDDAGRMVSAVTPGGNASYSLNALGQRVKKTAPGGTTYFVYDEAGHLLGEYNGSGVIKQEIIWLEEIPVAVLRRDASGNYNPYYIHTDHLNTPRQISRPNNNVVRWRWDADPFGVGAADADPDGDSLQFVFNLRFPGQYYDAETGLHYNYHRYYDPNAGRYITSDPIGLNGGLNTYLYAKANPLRFIDPKGLYGTKSCSYWDQACTANQGTHECKVAPELCPRFWDNDDPTGNSDKIGNWSECARQCLQEKHKNRMPNPQQCSPDNNISPGDNKDDHLDCWSGCFKNPENPYDPSGPNLPDGFPSLY